MKSNIDFRSPRRSDVLERAVVQIHVPHFDGGEQRRAPIPVFRIDVGAIIDQETRHVHVVVADRHEQRA